MVKSISKNNFPSCTKESIISNKLDDCKAEHSLHKPSSNHTITFSKQSSENGTFSMNASGSTQQHLFINNPQKCNSDQNNFCTSNSGLSFRSYSKNNGINYSQQQSVLQISKDVGCSEATVPLKHCKLKSSLSSDSGSNSKNTSTSSVVVDATSSFSTSHRLPQRTSTTSCTSQTADKASHDSSRNSSNPDCSSHEITLCKDDDDDSMKGGVDQIQFHNNCSESSSNSGSKRKTCSTTPSISLGNSQNQQVTQQLHNSRKTEMTNLTTNRQNGNIITTLGNPNDGPSSFSIQNNPTILQKNPYTPTTVICSLCDDDMREPAPVKPCSQQRNQTLMASTSNEYAQRNKAYVGSNGSNKSKDKEKIYDNTDTNINYDQNTTMEFSNSAVHHGFNLASTQQPINHQNRQTFHSSLMQSKHHTYNELEENHYPNRYKNHHFQKEKMLQLDNNSKLLGNDSSCQNISSSTIGNTIVSPHSSSSFNTAHPNSILSSFQDNRNASASNMKGNKFLYI